MEGLWTSEVLWFVHQTLPWFQLMLYLAPTEQWCCSMRSNCHCRNKCIQFLRFCHFFKSASFNFCCFRKGCAQNFGWLCDLIQRIFVTIMKRRRPTIPEAPSFFFPSASCKLCCFRTVCAQRFKFRLALDSFVMRTSISCKLFSVRFYWSWPMLLQSGVADRKAKVGARCVQLSALYAPRPADLKWRNGMFQEMETFDNCFLASIGPNSNNQEYKSQTSKLPCWRCQLFVSCEVRMTKCNSQTLKLQSEKHSVIFDLALVRRTATTRIVAIQQHYASAF